MTKVIYKKKRAKKPINSMSQNMSSWEWKPDKNRDIPAPKYLANSISKKHNSNKKKRKKVTKLDNADFYQSENWRTLRVRVLEKNQCKCMMCGRSPKDHNVVLHVDHIKPRSKYPSLSLTFENLQVLCDDCNIGKGNRYETDYRPPINQPDRVSQAIERGAEAKRQGKPPESNYYAGLNQPILFSHWQAGYNNTK